jgi:tryptophan synthase beta chain
MEPLRVILPQDQIPRRWYNVVGDVPDVATPVLHPGTRKPVGPADLAPLFPMELIGQEVSRETWVDIPEEILDVLSLWRPTPLHRARRFEEALGTPARIYYKNESVSPPGSHKPNTAVAQAYYNMKEGVRRIATETGAGQWGSALSFACNLFGLQCTVYMVRVSYDQKPYRKNLMQTWGATVYPSPSDKTNSGRKMLAENPKSPGSLGMAISEAVEDAATHDDTKYSLGSVLNHVLMHQTVVGLETKKQLEMIGEEPNVLIGCVGGGSNFAGFCFPFVTDRLEGRNLRIVAVEPESCPSTTRGEYRFDFGDTAELTPLVKMHTLGHKFVPPGIHAGGLRYHGMAPLMSALIRKGVIEATARHQIACFEAAVRFARTEGIVPAPETAHAIRVAIDEALECKKTGEPKVIVFNFSGHGHFDMAAYEAYFAGRLQDYAYPAEAIREAMKSVPVVEGF